MASFHDEPAAFPSEFEQLFRAALDAAEQSTDRIGRTMPGGVLSPVGCPVRNKAVLWSAPPAR